MDVCGEILLQAYLEYLGDEDGHLVLPAALDGDAEALARLLRHPHRPLPLGDLVRARPLLRRQGTVGLQYVILLMCHRLYGVELIYVDCVDNFVVEIKYCICL